MKIRKSFKYVLMFLMAAGIIVTGCSQVQETTNDSTFASEEELSYALPKIGEAAIINAEVPKGSKGTISVATVGSPNTEILQEAGRILEEKGYYLNIEVCEDYLTPNQLVMEGKVDCNYYQHAAFLQRYNIEKQIELIEMAKIHYEPMAIFSQKLENLEDVKKGAKVLIPENPTALAQAMWLLHDQGLITLMSDADMNTVKDDMAENPLALEIVTMAEEEILTKLDDADLLICHTGYALREAMDSKDILLVTEEKDSMMAQNLAQSIVVSEYPNENAKVLIDVLISKEMERFINTQYQGSIYMMDGEISGMEATVIQEAKEVEEDSESETGEASE